MTVLSRALIRNIIIQEMRLRAPSRFSSFKGSSSNYEDTEPLDIDNETPIEDIPSFMVGLDDETELDFDADLEDFGIDMESYDDDFEFESETEEDPDPESETEYNPGRKVMDMSGAEIRRHVMAAADRLSPKTSGRNSRTRAEMKYDDLVKQGREAEMQDPEFEGTDELEGLEHTMELPPNRSRKPINENVRRAIRQSIKRRMLLL